MPRLYLVRHGKIDNSGSEDPGLGDMGRAQAEAVARKLAPLGPLPIITSPSRRTRQTAAPLARIWGVTPSTDEHIGEIPIPPGSGFRTHTDVLNYARTRRWPELEEFLQQWRDHAVEALLEIQRDTVVVSHIVAINIAVAYARGDDRVTCFKVENCSCTVVESDGKKLREIEGLF